jgi:outer membrane protein assembly factor BamC
MKRLSLLTLVVVMAAVAGCSSMIPESKKIDYKSAAKAPTLEVPPDLTQLTRDDRFAVPDSGGKGSATYSAYTAERTPETLAKNSTVLPEIDKVRVERAGSERWLVVNMPADKLWDSVKDFWQENGFIIETEMPAAGIMETDWNENRAKIPQDFLRAALGKVIDSLYSTGEQDKFRTRLEPGSQPGTTDIFISHRGMEEVYSSKEKDQTRWQPRPPDPELEAEMLRRLMVRLGTDDKRAQAALASVKSEERVKLIHDEKNVGQLQMQEPLDRAWRRVGLALDRVGFTVEDRDRSKGIYFVRYVDPDADNKKKEEGFFSKLAIWKSKQSEESKIQYRVYLSQGVDSTRVQVLSQEGGADNSETAKKILALLYEQLK